MHKLQHVKQLLCVFNVNESLEAIWKRNIRSWRVFMYKNPIISSFPRDIQISNSWPRRNLLRQTSILFISPACACYSPKGASRKTLEIFIAEEQADQHKRHDDNRNNKQAAQNNSSATNKHGDKTIITKGTGTHPNNTSDRSKY